MILTTIGYQGKTLEVFYETLRKNQVRVLVDVRQHPISRKRGFSKEALRHGLVSNGMQYVGLPILGCPKEIRRNYAEDKNWEKYSEAFCAYLQTQGDFVEDLAHMVRREVCCLLCFEANYFYCHRRYVAEAVLSKIGPELIIVHYG